MCALAPFLHDIQKSSSPRIGLMIVPSDPFWIQIHQSVVKTNQHIGAELITLHPANSMNQLDRYAPEAMVDQILAHNLDALITTQIPSEVLMGLLSHGLPVLYLAEVVDQRHPLLTTLSEMDEGGRIAGEYIGQKLKGKGHAMIVTAAKLNILSVGQSRLRGFLKAMQQFPDIQVEHVPCSWFYDETLAEMNRVFANYYKPVDAIFGISDSIMFAVREAGLKAGKINADTLLIGLNGDPQALVAVVEGFFDATIDVGIESVGQKAIEFAYQAAFGKPVPDTIPFVYQLVTAENVATVAARRLTTVADLSNNLVGYDRQRQLDRLEQFEAMVEISHQIGSLLTSTQLSAGICAAVRKGFGYEWVRILRYDASGDQLVLYGGNLSPASDQILIVRDSLLQIAKTNKTPIIIPDTRTSFRWQLGDEWNHIRSRAIIPIQLGDQLIGLLDLQSAQPILQPSFETTGLELLATQVGIGMQNADLYQEALHARHQAELLATENARLYTELVDISIKDELTGALNRRGLMERGRNELSHAIRLNYPVGILMFDIDNFKNVNDTYGHTVGDQVLFAIVKLCQQNIREIDVIGRYGGDEFVILIPGCNLENTCQVGWRLLESVESFLLSAEQDTFSVTISVGVSSQGSEGLSLDEMIQKADLALYAAKQAGKNTVNC